MTTETKPAAKPADDAAARLAALSDHAAIKQAGDVGYNATSSLAAAFRAYVTRRSGMGTPPWDTAAILLSRITDISPAGCNAVAYELTGCAMNQFIADLRRRGGLPDDPQPAGQCNNDGCQSAAAPESPAQSPAPQSPAPQEPVAQARRQLQSLLDELRDDIAGISDDRPPAGVEVFDLRTRLQTVASELIGIAVILGGNESRPHR